MSADGIRPGAQLAPATVSRASVALDAAGGASRPCSRPDRRGARAARRRADRGARGRAARWRSEPSFARFDPARARAASGDRRARADLPLRSRLSVSARGRSTARRPSSTSPAGSTGSCASPTSEPVAIVGARRASTTGSRSRRSLGRGLGAAGVAVISGMALGIDSAAHEGALGDRRAHDRRAARRGRARVSAGEACAPCADPQHRCGGVRAAAGRARAAVDVPGAQPDHRGARRDDGRGRGRGALGRAAHGGVRPEPGSAGRSRAGTGDLAPGVRPEPTCSQTARTSCARRRTCSTCCSAWVSAARRRREQPELAARAAGAARGDRRG